MKIGVPVPTWKRHGLTRSLVDYYTQVRKDLLRDGIELLLHLIGSERHVSRALARKPWTYNEFPNIRSQLGQKFASGVKVMRERGADAVFFIGSDDFVSADLLRHYAALLEQGVGYMGLLDHYMFNLKSGQTAICHGYSRRHPRYGETVGAYRCMSRGVLDVIDWDPWPGNVFNNADAVMKQLVMERAPEAWEGRRSMRIREIPGVAIDVKTDESWTSWNRLFSPRTRVHCELVDEEEVFVGITREQILKHCG